MPDHSADLLSLLTATAIMILALALEVLTR